MIVIARDPNLGDAICAIPALEALRQKHFDLHILFRNEAVAQILPKSLKERLTWDVPSGTHEVLTIGAWEAVQRFGRDAHPTQLLMRLAGIDPPKDIPKPKIVFDGKAPEYDFVIAPFTADPVERGWPEANFTVLIGQLSERYPGSRIAVIGDAYAPTPIEWRGVTFEYGRGLEYVASLLRNAKRAVITLDSGPSRLAHAVACKNHVLLASAVTPPVWQTHPKCHMLYAPPQSWRIKDILSAIDRIQ